MVHSRSRENARLARIMRAINAAEEGDYSSGLLADLLEQEDDLGRLARAVDTMGRGAASHHKQYRLLQKVIPIGVALSAEKNFNRLLESLVVEAQNVTNADAGTLYLLEDNVLRFVIVRNASLNICMGGTSGNEITFPPVPLYNEDGSENRANAVSYATLHHHKIMIEDA